MATAEEDRLAEVKSGSADWRRWGTYLSERAWGTVREDYSADGDAWTYFPFEQARSRAYRWNEDGMAGWCDAEQTICMGLALWNGKDPFLKERPFGLTNPQGNHGEDVKEYWFYTDNLPTHAYASMVYKYPQAEFPYEDLVATNEKRGQDEPEYELFDALKQDWLENRYFDVKVEYAKASPEDVLCRITVTNRGPDASEIHILPHLWYRNTWSWESDAQRPVITKESASSASTSHPKLGDRWWYVQVSDGSHAKLLFCENETNEELLFSSDNVTEYVKDGIDRYVVKGEAGAANETGGSKAAALVTATIDPGDSITVTVRFAPAKLDLPFDDADAVFSARTQEADDFYTAVARKDMGDDERLVQRQALAGLLWCKQYYHYAVRRWLEGDPGRTPPPASRWTGRNSDWQHLVNRDVILMPDAWEYPWYAGWDLCFHAVTMAMIDPEFAKEQVLILLTSVTQHPHGQIPAYEWNFGDTNPPVHAWAAWQVYQLDKEATGTGDFEFLASAYRMITLSVMWWLNQKDEEDRGVFGGGFLGMDNIGVFDRDEPLPTGGTLAEVDGTSWMASMILQMLEITIELSKQDKSYDRMFGRWVWDTWLIANALEKGVGKVSFWSDNTDFYHDVIELPDGGAESLEVFSLQSFTPLFASLSIPLTEKTELGEITAKIRTLWDLYEEPAGAPRLRMDGGDGSHALVAVVPENRLRMLLVRMFDPAQFLSGHGIRSLSKYHKDHPYTYTVKDQTYSVEYAPAESQNRMFGGNSNWRGPVWFPMNFLIVQSLNTYARFFGDTFKIDDPTGSGDPLSLQTAADDLAARLNRIFLRDEAGRRAVFGDNDYFQTDEYWKDLVPFYEYYDGDNGRGLGASHQTGWTAIVALLLQYRGELRFTDFS